MSQDSVIQALEQLGGIGTMEDIIHTLKANGELGEVKYSTWKSLTRLKKNNRIDYTVSTIKQRGSPPRIYRVINQ